jgi:hypothetical protein
MPTKIHVLLNGTPLVGANIWLGEVGQQKKTTNESGDASFPNIVPPLEGYTEVLISGVDYIYSAKVLIVAGETNVVNLGTITQPT